MTKKLKWKRSLVLLLSVSFLFSACAGQQTPSAEQGGAQPENSQAEQVPDQPLAKRYSHIVVSDIKSAEDIQRDYPDALNAFQDNLVRALEEKNAYSSVVRKTKNMNAPAGSLLVQATVPEMRIVNDAARFWGGVFVGSSYMNIDLTLIDTASGKAVREKHLSSSNNAWAASWVGGASDRSLPADMGKLVAEYIDSIMPK